MIGNKTKQCGECRDSIDLHRTENFDHKRDRGRIIVARVCTAPGCFCWTMVGDVR